MSALRVVLRLKAANILLVFVAVQVVCIVMGLCFPRSFPYLSLNHVQLLLKSMAPLAILSIGVGILMISGEFDLSVGSNCALSAYIMAMTYNDGKGIPLLVAIALALLCGGAIGLFNGVITTRAKIPSFIVTLGGLMIWRGVLLFVSGTATASFETGKFAGAVFTGSWNVVQAQFVWAVLIGIGAHMLLEKHRLGNHMFSVGGNQDAARAIGVKTDAVKTKAFIICGMLAAFSGIISSARVNSVSPELGKNMELQAIAACVVGGLSLMGGVGSILGILLGAALLATIRDVLTMVRAPGLYLDLFVGVLIIVAVIFNRITRNKDV